MLQSRSKTRVRLNLRSVAALGAVACGAACTLANDYSDATDLADVPRIALSEVLRIGSIDDPEVGFSGIGPIDVGGDGLVYVGEIRDAEVRVYSPDGKRLRTVGRSGDGPGEFRSVSNLGVIGDTLWVSDSRAQRITLFALDGQFLSTFSGISTTIRPSPYISITLSGQEIGPDWRVYGQLSSMMVETNREDVPTQYAIPRVVFDLEGNVTDTVGVDSLGSATPEYVTVAGVRVAIPRVEQAPRRYHFRDMTNQVDAAYAVGDGRVRFSAFVLGSAADTLAQRVFELEPMQWLQEYSEQAVERAVARYRSRPDVNGEGLASALLQQFVAPGWVPPVSAVMVFQDGRLWLRREELYRGYYEWLVLEPDLSPVGILEVPASTTIRYASGADVWASQSDDLGVPWLVHYRLTPGG